LVEAFIILIANIRKALERKVEVISSEDTLLVRNVCGICMQFCQTCVYETESSCIAQSGRELNNPPALGSHVLRL
jgi:hypothetical protein